MNALNLNLDPHQNKQIKKQSEKLLVLPIQLKTQFPLSSTASEQVEKQRKTIQNILEGKDPRLMIITGPCSIHDPIAALQYAEKLIHLQSKIEDQVFLVMRAYIEKPRTTVGWKGLLYDPHLDGSSNLQAGLEQSRDLYIQIIEMGLPIASEILSPMATAYFDDLLVWGAIGARTSESQIHREISSHMPYCIGFKNGTDGSIQIAMDAIQSASHTHHFLGMGQSGLPCVLESQGNPCAHLILRGSNTGTNFEYTEIQKIQAHYSGKLPALVIDCSHGNSNKNPFNQISVLQQIIEERAQSKVRGVMLESFLVEGHQKISDKMTYGQSITDGCLGWGTTEQLLLGAATTMRSQNFEQSA